MSAAPKKKSESSQQEAALKAYNDIRHLESRLASLMEAREGTQDAHISFGFTVLSCVAQGNYERALNELEYVGVGFEEYRLFKVRTHRYVEHAKSLVSAIRVKHMIGRSAHVNKSKQKELSDKIADHFLELKTTIVIIEKIQKSVRAEDLSSTIYFVKTLFYSFALVIAVSGFYYAYDYLDISSSVLFSLDLPE
ncbi:MAG: hypothetical protein IT287_01265 [Bdellovibrionaceae bacterium]|nr:hypothetical protein [Pseudobdellovibrionaceae bacterium]